MGRATVCAIIAGFVMLVAGYPVYADEAIHPGKVLYQKYCESCHGKDGKGDGDVAPTLKSQPTDLTQLAKRNGGHFPFDKTVLIVDGRSPVRAHGTSDMPVWGERFEAAISPSGGGGREEPRVKGRIRLIVDYLRSIQEK